MSYRLEISEDSESYVAHFTVPKGVPAATSLLRLCNEIRLHADLNLDGLLVITSLRKDWLAQEQRIVKQAYDVDPYKEARRPQPHEKDKQEGTSARKGDC